MTIRLSTKKNPTKNTNKTTKNPHTKNKSQNNNSIKKQKPNNHVMFSVTDLRKITLKYLEYIYIWPHINTPPPKKKKEEEKKRGFSGSLTGFIHTLDIKYIGMIRWMVVLLHTTKKIYETYFCFI